MRASQAKILDIFIHHMTHFRYNLYDYLLLFQVYQNLLQNNLQGIRLVRSPEKKKPHFDELFWE